MEINAAGDLVSTQRTALTWEAVQNLDDDFWTSYRQLWQSDITRCAFQSPAFLRCLAEKSTGELWAFGMKHQNEWYGAVLMEKKGNRYRFLSDRKTDSNVFTFHRNCRESQVRFFFTSFFRYLAEHRASAELNYLPASLPYHRQLQLAAKESPLRVVEFPVSVCPQLRSSGPERIEKEMGRQHPRLPKTMKKFERLPGSRIEINANTENLEAWTEAYCRCHVKRWQFTDTPSALSQSSRRQFLYDCLRAWSQERLLLRFALFVNDEPVSFYIVLRQQDRLLGHSTTFNPEYKKLAPGRMIMGYIARWMKENKEEVFDFGYGGEAYKYTFANGGVELNRLIACEPWDWRMLIKAYTVRTIKRYPNLDKAYQWTKLRLIRLKKWTNFASRY